MTSQGSTPTVVVELEKHPTLPKVGCSLHVGPNPSPGRTLSRPSRSWWRPVRVRVIRSDEHRWNRPGDVTPGFRGDAEGITLITVQGLRKSYGAREGSPRSRPDGSAGRRSSATKRFSPPSDPARPVAKVSPNMCREAADIRHDSPAVSSSRSSSRRRAARRRVRPGTRHPRARRSAHHRPTLPQRRNHVLPVGRARAFLGRTFLTFNTSRNASRAWSRCQPVSSHNSSRITLLPARSAARYRRAVALVTALRPPIVNPIHSA